MIGYEVGSAAWWVLKTRRDPATGCILYTKPRPDGYMQVTWNGRKTLVHRLAYEQANGPIAKGLVICHRCDSPSCVNPEHLFAGTQKDNLRDMFAKGRGRPRGQATPPMTVFPLVSGRAALKKAHSNGVNRDLIHHIRTNRDPLKERATISVLEAASVAPVERWQHVTGVPKKRPTQALVKWERPKSGTAHLEALVKTGPELSRHCGLDSQSARGAES